MQGGKKEVELGPSWPCLRNGRRQHKPMQGGKKEVELGPSSIDSTRGKRVWVSNHSSAAVVSKTKQPYEWVVNLILMKTIKK